MKPALPRNYMNIEDSFSRILKVDSKESEDQAALEDKNKEILFQRVKITECDTTRNMTTI